MKNLAGHIYATNLASMELLQSGAEVVKCAPQGEVKSQVMGRVGAFTLTRAWVYWVADGYMPLDLAERLDSMPRKSNSARYSGHSEPPIMGDVVRVDGYAGGKRPVEGWVSLDADGREVVVDSDRSQRKEFDSLAARHPLIARLAEKYRWVDTKEEAERLTVARFIGSYHIDTEDGLAAFIEIARMTTPPECYLKWCQRERAT